MARILVSGASGINGYGILKTLRAAAVDHWLLGTSTHLRSPAQHFSDAFAAAVPTANPGYMDWLVSTIREHRIELVVPGIEADMYSWAENVERIAAAGAHPLLNRPELLVLCKDKWQFFEQMRDHGDAATIDSSLEADFEALRAQLGAPFVLKPRRGYGSRGVVTIADEQQFSAFQAELGKTLMAQEYVGSDDQEFTIAIFGDGDGGFDAALSMRRSLSRDGFTETAEVVTDDQEFLAATARLSQLFLPLGPTNFQFRQTSNGLRLLEINPRISSSTAIRAAFGYNEAQMAVEFFLEGRAPTDIQVKRGSAVRYVEEIIEYE